MSYLMMQSLKNLVDLSSSETNQLDIDHDLGSRILSRKAKGRKPKQTTETNNIRYQLKN